MTPEQFAYWLQGYAELNPDLPPTSQQWKAIVEHLNLVFVKKTPPLTPPKPDPYNIVNHFDFKELVLPTSPLNPNNIPMC